MLTLRINFYLHLLFLNYLIDCCISSQLFPHFLEGWIVLHFLAIVGPFELILVLSLAKHILPIFLLQLVLDLFDVFVRLIKDVDGLDYMKVTQALICCNSTSSSLFATSFMRTYPFYTIFKRSFFAFSKGISSFLLPVYLNLGTFSAILPSSSVISLFLELMKFLIVSLAFLSLNLTSSTFCISGFFGMGQISLSGYLLKHQPPIASKYQISQNIVTSKLLLILQEAYNIYHPKLQPSPPSFHLFPNYHRTAFTIPITQPYKPSILIVFLKQSDRLVLLLQIMQGYLELWQGILPTWNKYYFRIHEELLIYGPNKQEIQGRIHLKIAQIITKLDDPISLMINTGTETLQLRAYSIDEKVKWFKKLKQVQKQVINLAHNKQLFKMRVELSKDNRFKILDDLNTQLWKCHAELQQRLQEVIEKVKNVQILKGIDRLRISIDQFKYKTAQMLQYIDEEIRDLKNRDRDRSRQDTKTNSRKAHNFLEQDAIFNQQISKQIDNTQFFSFNNDLNQTANNKRQPQKMSRKVPQMIRQQSSVSSLSINLQQKRNNYQTPKLKMRSSSAFSENGEIQDRRQKNKLFQQNKVYLKYTNILSPIDNRLALPSKFTPQQKFSIVSTFISTITTGTDLTRITMPVGINEPLSTLQKGCQSLYYCDLLNRADEAIDENVRMLYVVAYIISSYSIHQFRTKKAFNPLLGQSYEFVDEGRGFQFLAEQVSHHPPVSAFYTRSDNFQIFDNSKSKLTFTGNGIKLIPQSKTIIKLQKNSDFYVASKCNVTLSNIIFGKTTLDIMGQITIKCKQFNTEAFLQFQEDSYWQGTVANKIVGRIMNGGKQIYAIQGFWNKEIYVQQFVSKEKRILWKKSHKILKDYYNFNELSLQLNNLTVKNYKNLPPTDSRFRPDQRALQYRDLQLAAQQKQRLQQNQRKRRKQTGQQKQSKPLWFKQSVLQGQTVYLSTDKYWDEKIKGIWRECPNIF